MKRRTLIGFRVLLVLVLLGAALVASAANPSITYTLLRAEKVSVNIYNSSGAIVRELLHAVPRTAGVHTEVWDRRDNTGAMAAPGRYTWKLLGTPGLTAKFITKVGENYPVASSETNWQYSGGPGSHVTPGAVAVDATGMYVLSDTCEGAAECFLAKLSLDGATRVWSAPVPGGYEGGGRAAASDGTTLYLMMQELNTKLATLYKYNPATGALTGQFPITWDPNNVSGDLYQYDMDANGSVLVVSYQQYNTIRWYNPTTGTLLDSATVPAPQGVSVASNGDVYVVTGNAVQRLRSDNHTLTTVYAGLTAPNRLDIDHANGDILVSDLGASQQVKRISAAGALLHTYGAAGGRVVAGRYTAAKRLNFRDVGDVTADGSGGFYVAEQSVPRRVAHFNNAGALLKELDGPMPWAPGITVDSNNYTQVWQDCKTGYIMQETIDYTHNTSTINAIYKLVGLASGMITQLPVQFSFAVRHHNGDTLLISPAAPLAVLKVDPINYKLIPLMAQGINRAALPASLQYLDPNDNAWIWTDADGDGIPQVSEIRIESQPASFVGDMYVDDNLTFYMVYNGPCRIVAYPVSRWNSIGAPVYNSFTTGTLFANLPSSCTYMAGYPAFLYHNTATGDMYVGYNDQMPGWGANPNASFLLKINRSGQTVWQAGRSTHVVSLYIGWFLMAPTPGTINAFRRNLGMVNNCVGFTDFSEGAIRANTYVWDSDGLWVGGLLDHPITSASVPYIMYSGGGEGLGGVLYKNPTTGKVYYYSHGSNYGRIFEITGWDNWERYSGEVTVTAPTEHLVANWTFDHNDFSDGSTYSNNGIKVGNAGFSTDTPNSSAAALKLNAASDAVTISNASSLRFANNVTIAFWVKGAPGQSNQSIFGNPKYSGVTFCGSSGNELMLRIDTSGGNNQLIDCGALLDNTWHHLCVSLASGTASILRDGVMNISTASYAQGNGFASTQGWQIGGGYVGLVDDVRINNRVLTTTEMYGIRSAAVDPLVLNYRFDDPASDHTATDSSVYKTQSKMIGETIGITTADTPRGTGGALRLAKISDMVYSDCTPNVNNISDNITIAFWVKAAPGTLGWIFSNPSYSGLCFYSNGNTVWMRIDTSASGNQCIDCGVPLDNTWHHLVARIGNGTVTFLRDGVNFSTATYVQGNGFGSTQGWQIGGYGFAGLLDDVRVYRSTLSNQQMQQVCNPNLATGIGPAS